MDRQPNLKEVAERAGVSIMTVSRCIRKQPGVAKATQAKVEAVIQELNYRPHPFISALMTQVRRNAHTNPTVNLAYLHFGPNTDFFKLHPPSNDTLVAAELTAKQYGFSLTKIWADEPGITSERLAGILRSRGCDGFLIGPLIHQKPPESLANFPWSDFAFVGIGIFAELPNLPRVATHQYHLMQQLLRQLVAIGYKRIGLKISKETDTRVDGHWVAAYLHNQERVLAQSSDIPIWWRTSSPQQSLPEIETWLQKNHIDFVLSDADDTNAFASTPHIYLMGKTLKLPDDSLIERNFSGIGEAATKLLISNLVLNQRGIPASTITQLVEAKVKIASPCSAA